jgi:hypothetical protein
VALGAALALAWQAAGGPDGRMARVFALAVAAMLVMLACLLQLGTGYLPRNLTNEVWRSAEVFATLESLAMIVAAVVALVAALRRSPWLLAAALAIPVSAVPVLGGDLMRAVAATRSSRDLAVAMDSAAPDSRVVLVGTYPTSLRWYLDRPVLVATATGRETTSNYLVSRYDEFRGLPETPLRSQEWWLAALASCELPTVFVTRRRSAADSSVASLLPLIATGGANGRSAAYGPCRPGGTR